MKKLTLLIVVITLLVACKQNSKKTDENTVVNEILAKTITATTNGQITSDAPISIRFHSNALRYIEKENLPDKLIDFKPSIKGTYKWANNYELQFIPNKPLAGHKEYHGTINLKELFKDQKDLSIDNYTFKFMVTGQSISSQKGDLHLKNSNNPEIYQLKQSFKLSQKFDPEAFDKALSVSVDKKEIGYTLEANNETGIIKFVSDDITRDDNYHQVSVKVDKKLINLKNDFTKSHNLSPLHEFVPTEFLTVTTTKTPRIKVEFTDEILSTQDINGLIRVTPNVSLDLQRIGNNVMLSGNFKYGTEYEIIIEKGLKSRWGTVIEEQISQKVKFPDVAPQVEFSSKGIFLPSGNEFKLQFYTCNLNRVHVEIKKVYSDENDLHEFLRSEQINSQNNRRTDFRNSYINRLGLIVHNESFEISTEKNTWKLNEMDLSGLIDKNGKGLYLVRLNFNPRDMLVKAPKSAFGHIQENGQIYKPIMFTNIGLTIKQAGRMYNVYATDINTMKPIEGVQLKLMPRYSYNSCRTISATTNSNGFAAIQKSDDHYCNFYYLKGEKNGEISIVKLEEMQWNISGFDVGGLDESELETQAFIYTERGVYRPGDEINISVIARHKDQHYPTNRPLTMDLINPRGKKVYTKNNKANKDGFYSLKFQTAMTDPTGNWKASFYIGNRYFSKTVKIETIVPFKLKTVVKPAKEQLGKNDKILDANIECKYLFGTPASNHDAEITAEITSVKKRFKKFSKFIFTNPTIDFNQHKLDLFEGKTGADGMVKIAHNLPPFNESPSGINIKLNAKILEKGGRPNKQWVNIPYDPYDYYVGIQPNDSYVKSGTDLDIPIIMVDTKGEPVAGKNMKYRIYLKENHWWWHVDRDRSLRYKSDGSTRLIKEGTLISGISHSIIRFLPVRNGTYYVEVFDPSENGHSAGFFFNSSRYGWGSESDNNAGMLVLKADKPKYKVGEIAKISFPVPPECKILVSTEQSDRILNSQWIDIKDAEDFTVEIPITKNMVPNAHVSVSVLQPHQQTANDRPIRTFGMLPLSVIDDETHHTMDIITAEKFRPEEPFEISVQASDFKKKQFTIAVVDEGLLDITQFNTPNPWKHFFRKLRLKIRTYDLFSQIISANKGDVFKTFAIGGDADYRKSQLDPAKKKRRFKPVSMFKGPIETDDNGRATVKFEMPNYIGSVRIMVISAHEDNYGSAEKAVPVKKELMILPTLPRVIGPGEKFRLPVSVFAMEENIGDVTVKVESDGPVKVTGSKSRSIHFKSTGDEEVFFEMETEAAAGSSHIKVIADNGTYQAVYEVDLPVRPSSPRIFESTVTEVLPGESQTINIPGKGILGTNTATITVTPYPGMNIEHRLKWLIHYPYGCIEQTTSAAFPQLYIHNFIKYPGAYKDEIDQNINIAIEKLRRFQLFSGAFSYWPGRSEESSWGTLYAGHFMVEAKNKGYAVPDDLYSNWLSHMQSMARKNDGNNMTRTYRAYIMAIAGEAPISEMNVLAESKIDKMQNAQKWMLAACYYMAGEKKKAESISKNLSTTVEEYEELKLSYGSTLRDKAIILDAMLRMDKMDKAELLLKQISEKVSGSSWYSTQSLSYSLLAMGNFMEKIKGDTDNPVLKGKIIYPDGTEKAFNEKGAFNVRIPKYAGKNIKLELDEESTYTRIYGLLNWSGVPLVNEEEDLTRNLQIKINWHDDDGNPIKIEEMKQGNSFWAHLNVKYNSDDNYINELALMLMLPSGWEVQNTRLNNEMMPSNLTEADLRLNAEDYLDIRDDRVMWFFDLSEYRDNMDFIVKLNAVTVGEFTMPPITAEAMYNNSFKARMNMGKVKVLSR